MPRNTRNAWATIHADGVKPIATGPRSASGSLSVQVNLRESGAVSNKVLHCDVYPTVDGARLRVRVWLDDPEALIPIVDALNLTLDR